MKTKVWHNPDDAAIQEAAGILERGGLVAFPTETVYGLGAAALDERAAEKIFLAKGRPSDNPLILHLASPEEAGRVACPDACYEKLAELFMPGPLTVILPKKECVPRAVTAGLPTVAVRVPSYPIARKLLACCHFPVAAPSANRSGRPSCTTAEHVLADMDGRIDAILDGGASDFGLESTILLPTGEREVRLLRPGAVTVEMLEENGFAVLLDKAVTEKLEAGERPLAPGMKYRHYAPRARVILLDGPVEKLIAYMASKKEEPGSAFLCYEEMRGKLDGKSTFYIGPRTDAYLSAHRLFAVLRELDERPEIETVYAPLPGRDHMGLALYNRLLKASGYTVIAIS